MPDDRQRLALYLEAQWPDVRHGDPVETAVALLEYLRLIDDSGVLPAIDDQGHRIERVRQGIGLA